MGEENKNLIHSLFLLTQLPDHIPPLFGEG